MSRWIFCLGAVPVPSRGKDSRLHGTVTHPLGELLPQTGDGAKTGTAEPERESCSDGKKTVFFSVLKYMASLNIIRRLTGEISGLGNLLRGSNIFSYRLYRKNTMYLQCTLPELNCLGVSDWLYSDNWDPAPDSLLFFSFLFSFLLNFASLTKMKRLSSHGRNLRTLQAAYECLYFLTTITLLNRLFLLKDRERERH